MNKTIFLSCLILFCITGCDLFDNNPKPKKPVLKSLSIKASNLYTVAGSTIPIKIKVKGRLDDGTVVINPDYQLYLDDELLLNKEEFSSEISGFYNLFAESEGVRSDTLQIEVRRAVQYEPKEFNVIFHIVHDGEELGEGYNISKERIDYQMDLLKAVFENKILNFTTNSTHPGLFFKLASVDPTGNTLSEKGINRIQRPSQNHSILFEKWMWDHYWDPDYYINVWVGETKNGFSWGSYPELWCDSNLGGLGCTDAEEPATIQGIALELENLWEGSWVFPHEVGHIFGLFHVFGPDKCFSDPDLVNDTPYYDRDEYIIDLDPNNSAIDIYREPCRNLGLTDYISYNVMDYHYQPQNGRDLTYDQVERMRYVVERGRFRASKDPESGIPKMLQRPKEVKHSQRIN